MSGFTAITYHVENDVATITMNRPEQYNALNDAMYRDLLKAFQTATRDSAVRAVILTGEGKGFCSGQDLMELSGTVAEISVTEMMRKWLNQIIITMRTMEKPIVGVLNGVAAGAGASLALACDLRMASDQASFVFAAFVNIGIIPDGGATYFLPQLVGLNKAFELALFADSENRVSAQKALELGIVNQVVAHDDLRSESNAFAEKLALMPTRAIGMAKRAMYTAQNRTLSEAIDYEAQVQGGAFRTHDFQEGVQAFLEKRKPNFKGE